MRPRTIVCGRIGSALLLLLGWSAICAPNPAKADDPVDRSVHDLQSDSPNVREGGEVRLYSLGPESFAAIEAASRRADLSADAAARLKEIVNRVRPLIGARLRWNRTRQADEQWNERTALAAYDAAGKKNPQWDDSARTGIRLYVSIKGGEGPAAARKVLEQAIAAGCDDPLVLYFEARCVGLAGSSDRQALDRFYRMAAQGMEASHYPADRKAAAMVRYVDYLLSPGSASFAPGRPMPQNVVQDIGHFVNAGGDALEEAFAEPQIPAGYLAEPAQLLLKATGIMRGDKQANFTNIYDVFQKAFPASTAPLIFKANFYVEFAWDARGFGYAKTVTPEKWKLFAERLSVAADALTKAYDMDPHDPAPPTTMLQVELGQGKGREVMEMWFKRAMKANPDNYDACTKKLYYLEPKWYGSPEQMIEFGRECRDSKDWYGRIPFMLVDAHQTVAELMKNPDAYYGDPKVWQDLASVYGPYLEAWPNDAWDRSRFCYYACMTGRWAEARRQFEILGDKAEPDRFDSEEQMRQFRQQALAGPISAP